MTQLPAITLTGPTASGKTAVGIAVAKALGFEIISADSMQIYEEMNVGTAKPTAAERGEVPHHLVDILPPGTKYSVASYLADAKDAAQDILSRGKYPLFVGGTGLYIDALSRGDNAENIPESDPAYRDKLLTEAAARGEDFIYERLGEIDPESAEKIPRGNLRRAIRALEIFDVTGKAKSEWDEISAKTPGAFKLLRFTLDYHDRDLLYRRTDRRVDAMLKDGLLDEVKDLYEKGFLTLDTTATQAIGYKELLPVLTEGKPLTEAVAALKLATRHYAKRQLTWFRRGDDVHRIFVDDERGRLRPVTDLKNEICAQIKASGFPDFDVLPLSEKESV